MISRLALLLLPLATPAARADGLADLNAALTRLTAVTAPLRATLMLRGESRSNEGKDDARIEPSQAQIGVEDGPQGLRLLYPQSLLAKAHLEELAEQKGAKDSKASSPTADGLKAISLNDVRAMLRPVERLQRHLGIAQFKGEKTEPWQGQPARLLSFSLPQTQPNKYVKDFSHELQVWINGDGVPLASKTVQKSSGRAYVVVSFEFWAEEEALYGLNGERLVALKRSSRQGGSGGGDKGQAMRTLTLTPG